jgi:hypothetical protein
MMIALAQRPFIPFTRPLSPDAPSFVPRASLSSPPPDKTAQSGHGTAQSLHPVPHNYHSLHSRPGSMLGMEGTLSYHYPLSPGLHPLEVFSSPSMVDVYDMSTHLCVSVLPIQGLIRAQVLSSVEPCPATRSMVERSSATHSMVVTRRFFRLIKPSQEKRWRVGEELRREHLHLPHLSVCPECAYGIHAPASPSDGPCEGHSGERHAPASPSDGPCEGHSGERHASSCSTSLIPSLPDSFIERCYEDLVSLSSETAINAMLEEGQGHSH